MAFQSWRVAYSAGLLMGGLFAAPAWAADCINGLNASDCTVPAGATSVVIELWGGGGGAGGADVGIDGGGGGGGGAYCRGTFPVTAGTLMLVTLGGAGAGGALGGTDGGNSTVDWGAGSIQAQGGRAGSRPAAGAGGSACVGAGLTGFSGGAGATGAPTPTVEGGAGGGSAGSASDGLPGIGLTGAPAVVDGGKGGNEEAAGDVPGGGGGGGRLGFGADGAQGRVKMTFAAAPPAVASTPVPSIGAWGVVLLAGILALLGLSRTRRSQR